MQRNGYGSLGSDDRSSPAAGREYGQAILSLVPFSTINTQRERIKRVAGSTAARLFLYLPGPPPRLRRCRAAHQCHRSNSRTHRHSLPGMGDLLDRKHQKPAIRSVGTRAGKIDDVERLALMPAEPQLLARDRALTNARTEERSARSARRLATARSNPHTRSVFASRSLTS
jgi:hypothetical protein